MRTSRRTSRKSARRFLAFLGIVMAVTLSVGGIVPAVAEEASSREEAGDSAHEPLVDEPVVDEPAVDDTTRTSEPPVDTSTNDETTPTTEAQSEEPAVEETTPTTESRSDEAAVEAPAVETPAVQESVGDEPAAVEAPAADQPEAGSRVDESDQVPTADELTSQELGEAVAEAESQTARFADDSPATIASDFADYAPGGHVVLTGEHWWGDEDVEILVEDSTRTKHAHEATVNADSEGSIVYEFDLPDLYVPLYTVEARGADSGKVATTTFTDSISVHFSQCANGSTGGAACDWLNGILNPNNSEYSEGMFVPQRVLLSDVPTASGTHTLTFEVDWTKGGNHAYDAIGSWDQAEAAAAAINGETWDLDAQACTAAIQSGDAVICNSLQATGTRTVIPVPAVSTPPFTSNNGGAPKTAASVNVGIDNLFGARTIELITNQPIAGASVASVHDVASLGDTGDSVITYTITYAVAGGATGPDQLMLEYAGHLAVGDNGNSEVSWGSGKGAGSISGGPYHHQVLTFDGGSLGQRDNQIQANAVAPAVPDGAITIVKDANPEDDTSFSFTATGDGVDNFSLQDPSDSSITFTQLAAGSYSFTETVTPGWALVEIDCGTATATIVGATATIELGEDESATCTFRNTKLGSITIVKDANPADDTSFSFTDDIAAPNSFTLSDPSDTTEVFSGVLPGTYRVDETNIPAGWNLDDVQCTDESVRSGDGVTIVLSAGENVTCEFDNTEDASVTVVKETDPDGGTGFGFSVTGTEDDGSFTLDDDGSEGPIAVTPENGALVIDEDIESLDDWDLTGIVCVDDDQQNVAFTPDLAAGTATLAAGLAAGQHVTCTFTNTERAGLVIQKIVDGPKGPTDGLSWNFTIVGPSLNTGFSLGDGGSTSPDYTNLLPGDYTITETGGPLGFSFSSVNCGDAESEVDGNSITVTVSEGASIVCTFHNQDDRGSITIVKDADPADGTQFGFTDDVASPNSFSLADGESEVFSNVLPGTYRVDELVPSDWNLTAVECSDESVRSQDGVTIVVAADENVTCTFYNDTNTGTLTLVKKVDGVPTAGWAVEASTVAPTTIDGGSSANGITQNPNGSVTFALDKVLAEGSEVTFDETLLDGYSFVDWVCVNGQETTGTSRPGGVNVTPGDAVTCTLNNTVNTAEITVIKRVDGVETAGWDVTVDPGSDALLLIDGENAASEKPTEAHYDFSLVSSDGTTVEVTEALEDGYTFENLECTLGEEDVVNFAGPINDGFDVPVHPGDSITCVFDNSVNRATVIVEKILDGEPAADWVYDVVTGDEPTVVETSPITTDETGSASTDVSLVLGGGSEITVTEQIDTGIYSFAGAVCVDGDDETIPTDVSLDDAAALFTLMPGTVVTCTFTNNSLPSAITLVKTAGVEDAKPGDKVTYTYLVTNTGETVLTDLVLVDDKIDQPIELAKTTLAPGESTTGTAIYTVTEADADNGKVVNVAVVTGRDPHDREVKATDTETVTVEKVLAQGIVVEAAGFCENDTPYLRYSVTAQNLTSVPDPATGTRIDWLDASRKTIQTDNAPFPSGTILWPGAAVDANGQPVNWPGWVEQPDGTWVQGDDGYGGVTPTAVIQVTVNPTETVSVEYPPPSGDASNDCLPNQPIPVQQQLPFTGGDAGRLVGLSLAMMAAGLMLILVRRRRVATVS